MLLQKNPFGARLLPNLFKCKAHPACLGKATLPTLRISSSSPTLETRDLKLILFLIHVRCYHVSQHHVSAPKILYQLLFWLLRWNTLIILLNEERFILAQGLKALSIIVRKAGHQECVTIALHVQSGSDRDINSEFPDHFLLFIQSETPAYWHHATHVQSEVFHFQLNLSGNTPMNIPREVFLNLIKLTVKITHHRHSVQFPEQTLTKCHSPCKAPLYRPSINPCHLQPYVRKYLLLRSFLYCGEHFLTLCRMKPTCRDM